MRAPIAKTSAVVVLVCATLVVIAALNAATTTGAAAGPNQQKPWDQILGPSQGTLPPPRKGLETTIELPTLRKEVARTSIKWETDLAEAMRIAKAENRPIFVTFRCLPCKSCSEFDKTVLEGGPDLNPLFQQFVTLRLTGTQDVDLRILRMSEFQDMDVSWWSWFLSPEGKIYGVFGGRDKSGDQGRTSKQSLIMTMNRVLAHHYDPRRMGWDVDGTLPDLASKRVTPVTLPGFDNWLKHRGNAEGYKTQGCVHCHQASEIMRQGEIDLGQFDKNRDLGIWPFPENIGAVVDRDDGLKLTKVIDPSPAARIALKPGDVLAAADGRRLFSQADFRAVLHRAAKTGPTQINLHWLRDGKVMSGTLVLDGDWRATDLTWRASVVGGNIGAFPGFWANDAGVMRQRLELPADTMAIKPYIGPKQVTGPAYVAGLRATDIVTSVNGETRNMQPGEFLVWFRKKFEPGDEITLTVRNDSGKVREVKYKAER
ncbi:PDZ domain-containing protein [Humisphaera borealis]|uniref:PDZ domain-containing protein n=1 Tax=Humisphaera borealis TaxID=2807512 RepID=A0A7M2WV88_9BACT|nr:PDZ domain-containing protein [Humisphaera borealis]QOV88751.1 PDZ domain-containing protein [Humisphaera borealis]